MGLGLGFDISVLNELDSGGNHDGPRYGFGSNPSQHQPKRRSSSEFRPETRCRSKGLKNRTFENKSGTLKMITWFKLFWLSEDRDQYESSSVDL